MPSVFLSYDAVYVDVYSFYRIAGLMPISIQQVRHAMLFKLPPLQLLRIPESCL